jgi:predicted negative regulator of RcsB-dependent stress response
MSEWFQLHNRQVTWGAIVVVALVGGFWFYNRSEALKTQRAQHAYFLAQQAIPGNLPLAQSDLQKLITRYDGTPAALQAQLTLTQLYYDQGKYQQGIESLKKAMPTLAKSKDFESAAHLLLGAGYEQIKKFLDAASEYGLAAKTDRFDQDRQRHESSQARAYLLAGKLETAKEIWTRLAADSKGTVAGEARVRLGELTAKPEPKT